MSAPRSRAARKKLRPIRPKPLMPTRMVTRHVSLPQVLVVVRPPRDGLGPDADQLQTLSERVPAQGGRPQVPYVTGHTSPRAPADTPEPVFASAEARLRSGVDREHLRR